MSPPSPGLQTDPAAAMDAAGDLTVAWQGGGNLDGSGLGIFAQQFDASGNPVGSTIPVNITTAGDQLAPAVAVSAGGGRPRLDRRRPGRAQPLHDRIDRRPDLSAFEHRRGSSAPLPQRRRRGRAIGHDPLRLPG